MAHNTDESGRLVPPWAAAALPHLGSTEPSDALAVVKLFDPCSRWTWYLTEYDPETRLAYGLVLSGLHEAFDELGYISIAELELSRNALGLAVERDSEWSPVPISIVRSGAVR